MQRDVQAATYMHFNMYALMHNCVQMMTGMYVPETNECYISGGVDQRSSPFIVRVTLTVGTFHYLKVAKHLL